MQSFFYENRGQGRGLIDRRQKNREQKTENRKTEDF